MTEEIDDPLIQMIKKLKEEGDTPVFSIDETGKVTDSTPKEKSTATTRIRNTDVVWATPQSMAQKGLHPIKGSTILEKFTDVDTTFEPRVLNDSGRYTKSKTSIDIVPDQIYWFHHGNRYVHSMKDINMQDNFIKAALSGGSGENISSRGDARADEGVFKGQDLNTQQAIDITASNVDEVTGVKGAGSKALKIVSKLGWADDLAIKAITTQIPRLFAGTMLAGASTVAGSGIATLLSVWSLGNLAIAAVRGAGTFAKEYGGDTLAALDAIAAGEIPEKSFFEAAKESFFEGAGEFGEQMQYDPFVMTIDKGFQMASGGRMQGQEDVFLKPAGWAWNAIKNNMVNPQSKYHSNYLPGGK